MRIVIEEEDHNRVVWASRSPLIKLLVGLLIASVFLVALLAPSPSPMRGRVVGLVIGSGLVIAVLVTLTTPLVDGGHLERLPDGGDIERTKAWPFVKPRILMQLSLDGVESFELETADFGEAPPDLTRLARLRIRPVSGAPVNLTDWVEPSSVLALGEALSRIGRRELVRLP
jgi:hypothetical protein